MSIYSQYEGAGSNQSDMLAEFNAEREYQIQLGQFINEQGYGRIWCAGHQGYYTGHDSVCTRCEYECDAAAEEEKYKAEVSTLFGFGRLVCLNPLYMNVYFYIGEEPLF